MVWFWGKIWLRTTSRRSPLDQEKLGYFDGSFQVMIDAMVEGCRNAGVDLRNTGISDMTQNGDGTWHIASDDGEEPQDYDIVLATTPSNVFQKLVPNLPESYTTKLNALEYEAAVVALIELDRSLTDIYWLNIADDDLPFT